MRSCLNTKFIILNAEFIILNYNNSNTSAQGRLRSRGGGSWTRDFSQRKWGLDMTPEKLCTSVVRAIDH